jgi:zinc protease
MLKKFLMVILFSTLILSSTGIHSQTKEKILPYPIQQYKMQNGLNVVTVPFDSPGIAAFYIAVRTGSRNEVEKGVTGFAHFFEHIMFRGTERYSKEKYEEVLKSIGASANANTSNDRTVYHMLGNVEKLELMFEIESDRFQNLKYSEHDFKTEAGAIKGEYTKNYADPLSRLDESINNVAFTTHTYKHTTMGFFADIVDMPNQYQYSLKFFDRYYRPEYCTVIVVGDVTQEKVNKLAEKYFGSWKNGSFKEDIPSEPMQTETKFVHLQNGDVPPYLTLCFKGPGYSDSDVDLAALSIIEGIAFSNKSDLYQKLVINERKVRRVGFYPGMSRDPNLMEVYAQLKDKNDIQYVKDELMNTLNGLKNNLVDKKMLDEVISNRKYGFIMRSDNPGSIAAILAQYIALSGDPESLNRYYELFDKVTPEDIMKTANKYFVETGLTIGTITADENCVIK